MKNNHDESKNLIVGMLVGGLVGAAALYFIQSAKNRKTSILKKVGQTLAEVGEMIEGCDFSCDDIMHKVEKKLPSGSNLMSNATDWLDMGIKLWKKFT